jgi:hypothetical protein
MLHQLATLLPQILCDLTPIPARLDVRWIVARHGSVQPAFAAALVKLAPDLVHRGPLGDRNIDSLAVAITGGAQASAMS